MRRALIFMPVLLLCASLCAQEGVVSGRAIVSGSKDKRVSNAGIVVSLTPVGPAQPVSLPVSIYRLTQKGKHFNPHLLVITLGSSVEFPNRDPFFHNVFSVYEGTRFDLGLYESGTSRTVKFTRPGPSYIFCNIHPQMSAVILTLPTSYFGVSSGAGEYVIRDVPAGEYDLRVWYERGSPEQLERLGRRITVPGSGLTLTTLEVASAPSLADNHKDKYGNDYRSAGYTIP